MNYRELVQTEYDRKLRLVVIGAEGLHTQAQDIGDGMATIGWGYTFNRNKSVEIERATKGRKQMKVARCAQYFLCLQNSSNQGAHTRTFVESEGIDQEGDISIEPNGCISVGHRNDAMNYGKDHHCWRAGRWGFQNTTKE